MDFERTEEHETPEEYGIDSPGMAARWCSEIHEAVNTREDGWRDAADRIVRRYSLRYDRDPYTRDEPNVGVYNLLWSMVETQRPALYSRTPDVVVQRRDKDRQPVARHAGEMLERSAQYFVEPEDFDAKIKSCVNDMLLPGRGVLWHRYCPKISYIPRRINLLVIPNEDGLGGHAYISEEGKPVNPSPGEVLQDDTGPYMLEAYRKIDAEYVSSDKVNYKDFTHSQAQTWDQVCWVARRTYWRQDAIEKRFGEQAAIDLNYDFTEDDRYYDETVEEERPMYPQAEVWEVWDKETKAVYWVADGAEYLLDYEPDPLGLKDFFPCSCPLFSTVDGDTLIPTPDYTEYRSQAVYIDDLTYRINLLTEVMRVVAVRDASYEELDQLLSEAVENDVIPVENFAQFVTDGGLANLVNYLPIDMIAATIDRLIGFREQAKRDVYELTGISDIVRGVSDPAETATGVNKKTRYGNTRLRERQMRVQSWIRCNIAIVAEIVANKFQPQSIVDISGMRPQTPDEEQLTMAAIQLLKSEQYRCYRLDIETDSTIEADKTEEKQLSVEFMNAVGKFTEQALEFGKSYPSYAKSMQQMLMATVRRFDMGRELESSLEEAGEMFLQELAQPKQPQQPPPNPLLIDAQLRAQAKDKELALKAEDQRFEQQLAMMKAQADANLKRQELEIKYGKAFEETRIESEKASAEITKDLAQAAESRAKAEKTQVETVTDAVSKAAETGAMLWQ